MIISRNNFLLLTFFFLFCVFSINLKIIIGMQKEPFNQLLEPNFSMRKHISTNNSITLKTAIVPFYPYMFFSQPCCSPGELIAHILYRIQPYLFLSLHFTQANLIYFCKLYSMFFFNISVLYFSNKRHSFYFIVFVN